MCVPFKNGVSISPSPVELLCTSPNSLNARCSRGSFSQCQISMCGDLTWGSEHSLLWMSIYDAVTFQSMGLPTWEVWGFLYCAINLLPLDEASALSSGVGYIFESFQSIWLKSARHLVMILLFLGEKLSSSNSIPPS